MTRCPDDVADLELIESASGDIRPADLILLFGTGHWTPAEVAVELYERRLAPYIVATGGSARHDGRLCEAEMHRDLMIARGIPSDRILMETTSTNTPENVINARPIIEELGGVRSVIAVVKWYHRRALVHLADEVPSIERIFTAAYEPFDALTRRGMTRARWEETLPERVPRETSYLRRMAAEGKDLLRRTEAGWVRSCSDS
jgi:uncharacterized SAM-binding protein YcdF (DUF218 family)